MNLRSQVLRGGVYLAIRQGMGMVISLVGVLFLTRAIGPGQYGLYTTAFGLFYYLQNVGQLGITVYLVRSEGEDNITVYHQAFTLLLLVSSIGVALSQWGVPLLAGWVNLKGFQAIFQVLSLSLPVTLLSQVPMAKLERQLDYKQVAWIEFVGQIAYFLVALPIAFRSGGAWSLVAGWWVQQLHLLVLFFWAARYQPRLCWQPDLVKQMLGYSIGYSASFWVWQLRSLVNPLLVGRLLGAEAVAYIALANRMVELLGFVKSATYRLSIAALARLQGDRDRMTQAITEGMTLQVLALGPFLAIISWLGSWFLPLLFGSKWLPVMDVYPFIALSLLVNALFNLHSSALYALQRNWEITLYHIIHIALFCVVGLLLIPRLGLIGYGWAEVATILSYGVIHTYLVRNISSPDYSFAGLLAVAFGLAMFPYQLGWWVVIGVVIAALLPNTQHKLIELWKNVRSARNAT
jgi:O-antigen/teichoic acid export membrane protein